MLRLNNISLSIGNRNILNKINLQISFGQHIGLVGRNGSGKSSIFKVIQNQISPDSGDMDRSKDWKILSVKQELPPGNETPLSFLLSQDLKRDELFKKLENCENDEELALIYEELDKIGAYSAEGRASKILNGMGFSYEDQNKKLSNFSGGFRMRVALAAALFQEPDLLLLDEPTNHLDIETCMWLSNFLSKYPKSFILISHERDFLNQTIDSVFHLKNGQINKYKGNFDSFLEIYNLNQKYAAQYNEKVESKRQSMIKFINRFGAKASKARQAQSRMKMIEKMQFLPVEADDGSISFSFPSPAKGSYPLIEFKKINLGYEDKIVLHNISEIIGLEDRIGLVGKNGNGKTTLAKFISGELNQLSGKMNKDSKLKLGFYKQDQLEELNLYKNKTLIEYLHDFNPSFNDQNARAHLARFGFNSEFVNQKIKELSGGEKARLLFARLTSNKPNLLILDEPTNHLDMEMRESLIEALNNYEGSVILITHDRYFLRAVVDQIWIIENKKINKFEESIEDYKFFG